MGSISRFRSCWIALGGALGAMARHGLESTAFVRADHGFPWTTFAINVSGTFLLGWILARSESRSPNEEWLRYFAGIGFCGAFTTFSTMNLELVQMARGDQLTTACLYFISSFLCGLAAAWAGARLGFNPAKECV